jgi:O-acetylserine/cysteine efflux transporter
MRPIDAALTVGIMMIWGLNFVVAKLALAEMPAIFTMSLRFALVAILLLPFVKMPSRQDMKAIALLGFTLGGLHFSSMFTGMKNLDAGLAAISTQSQVPFAALLSAVILKDYPGWRRWTGMGLAFFGIWLATGGAVSGAAPFYVGLVLFASFMWAVANFQFKSLTHIDGFTLNAYTALWSVPFQIAFSAMLETGQIEAFVNASWRAYAGVVFMSVMITICTYWMWYRMLRRYSVNVTMPYTLLVPVFGVMAGVIFNGDDLGWRMIAGTAATIAGVAIIVLRRPADVGGESTSKMS